MVARHNRRGHRHPAGSPVCIDCGTRYLFTSTYKGNYCPDCHETWADRRRDETSPSRSPPRLRPAQPRPREATPDDDPHDEE